MFRSPLGFPVSCEISVELDDDGLPVILSSVEIESGGTAQNRILSQSPVDGDEVLLIYRGWRRRSENQVKIRRLDADSEYIDFQQYGKTNKQRQTRPNGSRSRGRGNGSIYD